MGEIEFLIAVLFAAAVLVRLADLVAIPYPIVLVVGGVAIGFVPGLPDIELAPEAIFLGTRSLSRLRTAQNRRRKSA